MPQTKPIIAIVNVVASATIDQKLDLVDITKKKKNKKKKIKEVKGQLEKIVK